MDFFTELLDTLQQSFSGYLPNAIIVILILILGYFIAKFLKRITIKLIEKTGIDKKTDSSKVSVSKFIGKLVYFLIMVFTFMVALERLGMTSVLEPAKNLLNGFTEFIPNIVGATLVGYIGYMLAKIVSEFVGLSGETIQNLVPKLHLPQNINLVNILKKVVFIFIFIPLLIAALNILNLDAVSQPATYMLQSFFDAIPKILLATVILIFFVIGGRFVSGLIKDLLDSLNFNEILEKAKLNSFLGNTNVEKLITNIVYAFIILFGLITALEKLGFAQLTEITYNIGEMAGNIIFGLIILAVGNWIANIAVTIFNKSGNNPFVANIIKVSVLAVFLAIGLNRMGIADEIVNLAFGIVLATVGLTVVLSFGLGGREAAGKQMSNILEKFNKK
ncbi:mechanosensitive ion channel [Aestuariibaculum sediminum]|uniref:Mechanosensitive ion channel n=1 Tax=Aestuariibaculum sediminum TaxID=2770637 RepID=A0A8J6QHA5_9FLAO|nr:mechanosensitive ion channel [Aestuariibaculum sediminum]MBD0831774.1 mechanosensitive ion channel [Aestuariibaculum sediminum]